jgi:hypothetical protein
MYRLFLQSLGYAKDLDLASSRSRSRRRASSTRFEATYREMFEQGLGRQQGRSSPSRWRGEPRHAQLFPTRYQTQDSWVKAVRKRRHHPGTLAERARS